MNIRLKLQDAIGNVQIGEWYDQLLKSQFWSEDQLHDYQNEKLQIIINHAYENVPYYKELFRDLGLTPSDIRTKEDLYKIPVITREVVRENLPKLLSDNYQNLNYQIRSTGGTTGVPLKYYSDINSWSMHWALKYRAWEWGGYQLGDAVGILGGASIIPEKKVSLKRKLWNKLNNFYPLPSSHLTPEMMTEYANQIQKKNFHYLRGYPSSITTFSKFCIDQKIDLDIQSVFSTAEVLRDEYKDVINSAFEAKVYDTYGCADGGGNANTCEYSNGFHVSMESSIWEVCNDSGERASLGETGEVTLTSLSNFVMPLLRYQPGDLIENTFDYSACQCGRSLPRIKKILGRSTDILKFFNDRSLGGPAFTLLFREFSLKNYQLVQNSMNSVDVNIVPSAQFDNDEQGEIFRLVQHHCGEGVTVNVHILEEITPPLSGKNRFIINNTHN